jgi:putative tryptophan/tyrosine transport system substrate-binding protein
MTLSGRTWWALALLLCLGACSDTRDGTPTVGFVEAFEDATIGQARSGFIDALGEAGFNEADGTLRVIYRNAQGDIPTLTQITRYLINERVDLLATSPSLSTITAVQNTKDIPIFMMVAPTPELMQVTDVEGTAPANLLGVAENLDYIDTAFGLIPELIRVEGRRLRVGVLYNQSEPQSVSAVQHLSRLAESLDVELFTRAVSMTADVNLTARALLEADIDAFFANPDNTVFGAFETLLKTCNEAGVPIFTSEAGLVARGAVAAFGADLYSWGYQAGVQARLYLQTGTREGLQWELVQDRRRVYNPDAAARFGLTLPADFQALR